MPEAFIVDAVRTPVGKRGGGLAAVHPADLGGSVLTALVERTGIDPGAVEDVVFGCVDTVGPQAGDIARTAWLVAGLPDHVPGTTVDRQCGSSQQAVHFAAQAVMSGTADVVVAGGVQNMSAVPISYAMIAGQALGFPDPFRGSPGWQRRYGDQEISQFRGAELIADQWEIPRSELDELAVRSHRLANQATQEGRFEREIVPMTVGGETYVTDQGIRPDTSLEALSQLKPAFKPDGTIHAGNSSQISDGSAALLMMTSEKARQLGLTPLARVHTAVLAADDPVIMLTAPIPATKKALKKSGLAVDDIGVFEVNEAFSPVPIAWLTETGADPARLNPNGGAIALGHPLGGSGARIMTTMLHHMVDNGLRYGLQTMCEGGGQANATILELL